MLYLAENVRIGTCLGVESLSLFLNETQMWVEGCECCFCEPRLQYKYSENTNTLGGVSVAENGGIDTLWGRKARRRRRGQRNVTRRR